MLQVDRQQTVPFALQHSPRLHSWSFPKHHATSGHCHQNNKNDCRSTLQTIVIENLNCLCLQTVPLAVERFKTIAVKSCRSSSKPIETRQQIVASSQSPSKSPIFTSKVHFSKLHTVVKTRQKRVKSRRSKTIVAPRCNRSSLHAANDQFLLIKSHRNLSRASSKSVFRVSKILKMKQDRKGTC